MSENIAEESSEVQVELLAVGDLVKVPAGNLVPVDGVVQAGAGLINESMLTGEDRPVAKEAGAKLYGGTLVKQGCLIMKVTKPASEAVVNQLITLVEQAQAAKAPIQQVADRIA